MSLIDRIEREMKNDDEDRTKQSRYLLDAYEAADEKGKASIDECFIALCGWKLSTVIEMEGGY